tara:strand:+ start:303 stop:536 length:234 start_codon:yes stop_codon:yes gene_type:complete
MDNVIMLLQTPTSDNRQQFPWLTNLVCNICAGASTSFTFLSFFSFFIPSFLFVDTDYLTIFISRQSMNRSRSFRMRV